MPHSACRRCDHRLHTLRQLMVRFLRQAIILRGVPRTPRTHTRTMQSLHLYRKARRAKTRRSRLRRIHTALMTAYGPSAQPGTVEEFADQLHRHGYSLGFFLQLVQQWQRIQIKSERGETVKAFDITYAPDIKTMTATTTDAQGTSTVDHNLIATWNRFMDMVEMEGIRRKYAEPVTLLKIEYAPHPKTDCATITSGGVSRTVRGIAFGWSTFVNAVGVEGRRRIGEQIRPLGYDPVTGLKNGELAPASSVSAPARIQCENCIYKECSGRGVVGHCLNGKPIDPERAVEENA